MTKYSNEKIIEQFKKIHGNKFDYSLVEYIHSQKKVKIICRIHGEFEQLVGMHRKGQGCAKCMYDGKRHSKEQVIKKFIKTHGSRYCYSQIKYINTDTKINIICYKHGVFQQTPDKHIAGNGCPKCIGKNKNISEVIKDFKEAHGETYSYSKVNFEMLTVKVEITCKIHGSFWQKPQKHISGQGCPKCGGRLQYSNDEAVKGFQETHGNKYNYSLVNYKNSHSKIEIICLLHGVFKQTAGSHKGGSGCPLCAGNYTLETNEVIQQFKIIHGDRYEYSKVEYVGAFKEVVITCKVHGEFKQMPRTHKKGSGCPKCAITIDHTKGSYIEFCKMYASGESHLYVIQCFDENELFYKVGISYYGANLRFNSKGKMPYNFKILNEIKGDVELVWNLEKKIHKLLKHYRVVPMKAFHGSTECFREIPEKVKEIIKNIEVSKQLILAI